MLNRSLDSIDLDLDEGKGEGELRRIMEEMIGVTVTGGVMVKRNGQGRKP